MQIPTVRRLLRIALPRCAFGLALAATAVALIWAIENHYARKAWLEYVAGQARAGGRLDYREFIPPPAPEEENFFCAPFFGLFGGREGQPTAGKIFRFPNNTKGRSIPGGHPSAATLGLLPAWRQYFLETGALDSGGDHVGRDVLRALDKIHNPAWALLIEAVARPKSRIPAKWDAGGSQAIFDERSSDVLLPASGMHRLRLIAHLACGDGPAAAREALGILRLGEVLHGEPTLLCAMLRAMLVANGSYAIRSGLHSGLWGEEELLALEEQLKRVDVLADYAFGMESEKAWMVDYLDNAYKERLDFFKPRRNYGGGERLMPAFAYDRSKVLLCRQIDKEILSLHVAGGSQKSPMAEPYAHLRWRPWNRIRYFYYFLATYMLAGDHVVALDVQTVTNQARIACALARWHIREGAYPAGLESLVPAYLGAMPLDPRTGETFGFRQTDDGKYLLLSTAAAVRIPDGLGAEVLRAGMRDGTVKMDGVWHYLSKD